MILVSKDITSAYDLRSYVPGLEEYNPGPGRVNYSIRGIGNEDNPVPTADGGVGIFQDEVYIGRSFLVNNDFLDVDRVEVLRGPQGTLYGRNTIGGAISFFSRQPTDDARAGADLSFGNYNELNFSGYASGMITDGLDGKIAVSTRSHDGYDTNTSTGAGLDDERFFGLSGALRWRPINSLDVTLNLDTSHRRGNGSWWILTSQQACPGPQAQYDLFTPCSYSGQTQPGQIEPDPRKGPRGPDSGQGDINNAGGSLNIKWTNPLGLLTSISSYRRGNLASRAPEVGDVAELHSPIATVGADPAGGTCPATDVAAYNNTVGSWPLSDLNYTVFEYDNTEQYSQELRLSSQNDSPLTWITGAYFYREATIQNYGITYQYNFPAFPGYAENGSGNSIGRGATDSYALFANAAYNITDALKIQGGLRWTEWTTKPPSNNHLERRLTRDTH